VPALALFDFASELAGYSDPEFSVGWDGSIFAIARLSTESPVIDRGIGIFPKSKLDHPTEHQSSDVAISQLGRVIEVRGVGSSVAGHFA
jgi:hypothetical protein